MPYAAASLPSEAALVSTDIVGEATDEDITLEAWSAQRVSPKQAVELGSIKYVNWRGGHGDVEAALTASSRTGKPLFVNFVEAPG